MIQTYDIEHLENQGDVEVVSERLKSVDGVRTVAVSLEQHRVTIDMDSHINLSVFNAALSANGPWRLANEHVVRPAGPKRSMLTRLVITSVVIVAVLVILLLTVLR